MEPAARVSGRLDFTVEVYGAGAGPEGDSTSRPAQAGRLVAAAGGAVFFERLLNRFAGFARALLNAANEFFLLAFGELEIVIRELGPLLFQLALGDVPVAFDFKCCHNGSLYFCGLISFTASMTANVFPQPAGLRRLGRGDTTSYGV